MSRFTLRARFALVTAALVVGVTVLLGWIASRETGESIQKHIGDSLAETAYQMADKLDRSMDARVSEVELILGMRMLSETTDPAALRYRLEQLQQSYDVVSWIGFIRPDGTVQAATGGILEGVDISHRPVFINGRRKLWVGDVHDAVMLARLLPTPGGEPMKFVDIAAPVQRADGSLSGVLAVHLSWNWADLIEQSMLSPAERQHGLEVFVVADDGVILLGPHGMVGQSLSATSLVRQPAQGAQGWSIEEWPDGHHYLTGFAASDGERSFDGLGWKVLTRKPVKTAFAPVRQLQMGITIAGGVLACLFALLGWHVAVRISAPLMRLSHAADEVREDADADSIPLERSSPELTRLSISLREMVARILSQRQTIDRLKDLAHADPLTGLPNRAFLDQYLQHILPEAEREGRVVAIMFLDLDGFKQVNDRLGHHAGDLLLIEVAERLRTCLRGGDIAARLGGDEFVVVIKTDRDKASWLVHQVGERILKAVSQPVTLPQGDSARVGCSIGVALWPAHGVTAKAVMACADAALYVAKASGKGNLSIHGEAAPGATGMFHADGPAR
ncbi:diguanylate cyclase [Halomonas shantousis]